MSNPTYGQLPNNSSAQLYNSGDAYYQESSGYQAGDRNPPPAKKGASKWIKIGIPVLILVIIGVVVGVVLGMRKGDDGDKESSSTGSGKADSTAPSDVISQKQAIGLFATGTNSLYMVPLYPATTNSAAFGAPTFVSTSDESLAWPADDFKPSTPSVTNLRPDRPRLIAPAYKWAALPTLIRNDPYLQAWNETIFANATRYAALDPVKYFMDGPSGILDNAREVKQRVKTFAYVYRMTKDTKWVDRTWVELANAFSDAYGEPGGIATDKWNPTHFLDVAEFSAAFGIAYDWLHEIWTEDQKSQIRTALITYGLNLGVTAYDDQQRFTGWWTGAATTGNWNCVCNGGLTLGALAILDDDTTGTAAKILALTVENAKGGCSNAVAVDGTWAETANYWYFGTTSHSEMASALITATGSKDALGLMSANPNFGETGKYHMYAQGATSLFNYGDHGPNKFSATANSILFYSAYYNEAEYALFQRDQHDAADPWSMFWYNPAVKGAFWNGLPLDHFFTNDLDQWASMRSSWTDINALYVATKAGKNKGLQTHNDLDAGTFVVDALGTRWAGEYGSGDYNSLDYFSNDTQASTRWTYYRKMTEGQSTILVAKNNQNVDSAPKILKGETTGEKQGSSTVYEAGDASTAIFTTDLTSAYFNVDTFKRGVRLINGRKQVLIQDDITTTAAFQWRMQTNATISVDAGGTSATLTIDDKTMKLTVLNAPAGLTITSSKAERMGDSVPKLVAGQTDQENVGSSVVIIALDAGTYNLQVLLSPQWPGMKDGDYKTPAFVAIDQWTLTSHN